MCCQHETITKANWHCGHVISNKNGGMMTEQNMRPICMGCNVNMRDENMKDYMERLGFNTISLHKSRFKNSLLYVTYTSLEVHVMNGDQIKDLWRFFHLWDGNRTLDMERARGMAGKVDYMLAPMTLCKVADADILYLIDGQHRHMAWTLDGCKSETKWLNMSIVRLQSLLHIISV